jgi:integrase
LTLAEASRIVREAVKDRAYRATPLGLEVARYYRWKKNEWGATKDTLRDYEAILAKLALYHADLELADMEPPVGTERLRECWDHFWGERSPRTRAKVRSVWVDFFDWAARERGLHGNPARALASPKKRGVKREPFGRSFVAGVIAAQSYPADELGVTLILEWGLRRAELAGVRFGDFDYQRRHVTVTGKGGKVRTAKVVDDAFWMKLRSVELDLHPAPTHFLICQRRKSWHRTFYWHHKGFSPHSMHKWWYDRLEEAGLVGDRDSGTRTGLHMHRGRHTVASEILAATGNIVAAKEQLGHEDVKTTVDAYATFNDADLVRELERMHAARRAE